MLGGIRGQRAAIDGEVVLAKSPRSIGAQQHFGEHGSHFVGIVAMTSIIVAKCGRGTGRPCNELNVALTGFGRCLRCYSVL